MIWSGMKRSIEIESQFFFIIFPNHDVKLTKISTEIGSHKSVHHHFPKTKLPAAPEIQAQDGLGRAGLGREEAQGEAAMTTSVWYTIYHPLPVVERVC